MTRIGYYDIRTHSTGARTSPGASDRGSIMAQFKFEEDISLLFPYINAVADKPQMYENPGMIRFDFGGTLCMLHSTVCMASPFDDRQAVIEFAQKLVQFLKDIDLKKDSIVPSFKLFQQADVTQILKVLPKTNCKKCGYQTCLAFAAMLAKQQVLPSKCPYLGKPVNEKVTFEVYDENGNPTSSVTIDVDTSKTDLKARDKNKTLDANAAPFKKNTISESDANMSLPVPLTKREYEVLSMMARGLTNKEISDELFISPHTVKSHVINIFNKLGVNHRTQAVVWAARNHLI